MRENFVLVAWILGGVAVALIAACFLPSPVEIAGRLYEWRTERRSGPPATPDYQGKRRVREEDGPGDEEVAGDPVDAYVDPPTEEIVK